MPNKKSVHVKICLDIYLDRALKSSSFPKKFSLIKNNNYNK